jgi:hypothetical protein
MPNHNRQRKDSTGGLALQSAAMKSNDAFHIF